MNFRAATCSRLISMRRELAAGLVFGHIVRGRLGPIMGDEVMLRIVDGGLDDPQVIAMLRFHFDTNVAVTPRGSAHVFDLERLKQPDIWFWSAWNGRTLMGTGALKRIGANDGEIKSMHTLKDGRRTGVGSAMVRHILSEAKAMGLVRLYLETGSFDYFAPARALYTKHGFVPCPPFDGYKPDPNSMFMMREI